MVVVRGLDLVHGGDVAGLNVVLEVCDLLLKFVDGNLFVFNDAENLKRTNLKYITFMK